MVLTRLVFNLLNAALFTLGLIIVFLAFFTNMQEEVPLAGIADERLRQSSFTIGIIGIVIVGTAAFGFLGVNRNVKFFTGIYILCLGLAALSFIALGVYIITNAVQMRKTIQANVRVKMITYHDKKEVKEEIDNLQKKYECCGIKDEGAGSNVDVFGNKPIPLSCCEEDTRNCTLTEVFKVGCDVKVEKQLERLFYPLAGTAFVCAIYCIVVTVLAGWVKKPDE